MPPQPRILVVGSANIDFSAETGRIPLAGETIVSDGEYSFVPGGKGANAAVAAARLGADVVFCSRIGADSYGKQLHAVYRAEGIDTRYVITDKEKSTGLAAVFLEQNGDNRIIVYPGANRALSSDDVEEAMISYPDALLTQFETPLDTVYHAIRQANAAGVPVFLDAGPALSDLSLAQLGKLEAFSPNENEAYAYTGIRPTTAENYIKICIDLYAKLNTTYVVLKLGDRGCYLYDGRMGEAFPAYHVNAVDTTAAGDAFTAALTYEYLRSGDVRSACRYANAVGALAVSGRGAFPSLPREKDVLAFLSAAESV